MIEFRTGNLLESNAEALVNTVNTVGVMGKGIALMFKDAFPDNYRLYQHACRRDEIRVGHVFVTEHMSLGGKRWIVNFPTKQHWRGRTHIDWIASGLVDLRRFIVDVGVQSIAIPPLGCGNGGLEWSAVRAEIESKLAGLKDVEITVYQPTTKYQNVSKRKGVKELTPARALVAELVRRYSILGIDCTVLEVQKLAWLLERMIYETRVGHNPLELDFAPNRFGPYADKLRHLLDSMDGSYLHCSKRLADAEPLDAVWFEDSQRDQVATYLGSECKQLLPALDATARLIDGFESPLGMELLATVDWLVSRESVPATVDDIRRALAEWFPSDPTAGRRKLRIFDERLIGLALERLRVGVA